MDCGGRWQRSFICSSWIPFHLVFLPSAILSRSVVSVTRHSYVFSSSAVPEGFAVLLTHLLPSNLLERRTSHTPGLGLPGQNRRLLCVSPACSTSPSAPGKPEVRVCPSLPQMSQPESNLSCFPRLGGLLLQNMNMGKTRKFSPMKKLLGI